MTRKVVRRNLIDSVKKDIMGPRANEEIIEKVPIQQYLTGIIYPEIINGNDALDEIDDRTEKTDEEEETFSDIHLPQSIGLSILVDTEKLHDEELEIKFSGAVYNETNPDEWKRASISKTPPFLILKQSEAKILFNDEKTSKKIPLKNIKNSIGAALDGFFLVWETNPFIPWGKIDKQSLWYLSIFLVNERKSRKQERAQNSLFQTYISVGCKTLNPIISRNRVFDVRDQDAQSIEFLYNDRHEFGVGHQTSINWDSLNDSDVFIGDLDIDGGKCWNNLSALPKDNICGEFKDSCKMVETTFFPENHMKSLDFDVTDLKLNMYDFSDEDFLENGLGKKSENIHTLNLLADKYETWIKNTFSDSELEKYSSWNDTFQHHKKQCNISLNRIREGIRLLNDGPEEVYLAFSFMNRAIWLNWINKRQSKDYNGTYFVKLNDKNSGFWRAFQLAFILQNISGIVDRESNDRDIVDMLWVSTGGGKTEAYLGLVAFIMFLRRLRGGLEADDGIEILMRYTLRLLTIQQFQRAARLVMACEYIRKIDDYPVLKGCKPFSIGLFVGQNTTPNKLSTGKKVGGYDNDYDIYTKVYKKDTERNRNLEYCAHTAEYALGYWKKERVLKESENPVQLLSCPWCGYRFQEKDYILDRISKSLHLRCGNEKCPFHREDLNVPIMTVDESILEAPPSLLIGTVDKFAQITFNEHMGRLFGWNSGKQIGRPPDLIIQDELHLINGPLGSMVGLYEASIDYLSTNGAKFDMDQDIFIDDLNPAKMKVNWNYRSKVIASTATIRNASRQCKSLYDRRTMRFPSSGTNISDSFFVKEKLGDVSDKVYIGVYCAGIGMKTSMKRAISEILLKVSEMREDGVALDDYDPYWTIVSYYNSRRELGSAVTLMRDDVRTKVEDIRTSILSEESIGELHGGLNSTDLPLVLERLESKANSTKPSTYDIILCTNMFSVGIDIDRLGLMMMNCQPKATTEYLQSTGRVGRTGEGLIFVLFNQARPRDQSHFERFYDYHSRVQSHVESMTVTPYSEGCIDRALHAQYVALMRNTFPISSLDSISKNNECINFSLVHSNHEVSKTICLFLLQRARNVEDKSEIAWKGVLNSLLDFQSEWLRRIHAAKSKPSVMINNQGLSSQLLYAQRSPRYQYNWPRLLEQDPASPWFNPQKRQIFNFDLPPILTPNSLRNVEEEIQYLYLGRRW